MLPPASVTTRHRHLTQPTDKEREGETVWPNQLKPVPDTTTTTTTTKGSAEKVTWGSIVCGTRSAVKRKAKRKRVRAGAA